MSFSYLRGIDEKPVVAPPDQGDCERDGPYLRMPRTGAFPDRCITCNESAEGRMRRPVIIKSHWNGVASSSFLTFAVLAVLADILLPFLSAATAVGLVTREKVTVDLPVCTQHRGLHALPMIMFWIYVCILVTLVGGASVASYHGAAHWLVATATWMSFGAIPFTLACFAIRAWMGVKPLTVEAHDAHYMWLSGAGKPFMRSILRVNSPRRQHLATARQAKSPARVSISV